jgi:TRAP-type C4-dicarboxylate transport system permease small subunit
MRTLLRKGAGAVGAGLFAALFLVFVVQVGARFGFNKPIPWTDELAVVLYVWVILWCAAFVVPEREHVVFDLVWNVAGRRVRQGMKVTGNALIGVLSAWAIPGCWDYVRFMGREGTAVLGIPFSWVFAPFVALLVALVLRSALGIWQALHGQGLEDAAVPAG